MNEGKGVVGTTIGIGGLAGSFNGRGMLGKVDRAFRTKGVRKVVKFGNSNGAMVFGYVYNFLRPSEKDMCICKGEVKGSISFPRGAKVVVRDPKFLPCVDKCRGLGQLTRLGEGVKRTRVQSTVSEINLSPFSGGGMNRCSLKVERHLKVTRTVVRQPGLLVLSRPFGKLSGENTRSIYRLFIRLGRGKAAVLLTTRGIVRVR